MSCYPRCCEGAGELVERVVAADVFTDDKVGGAGREESGGMGRARRLAEDLRRGEPLD